MWFVSLISVSLHTCPPLFSGVTTRGPSEKRLLVSLGRLPEAPLSNRSAGWPTPQSGEHTQTERTGRDEEEEEERRRKTRWEKGDTTLRKLDC